MATASIPVPPPPKRGSKPVPLLFLDTNALHYARLHLDFLRKHCLVPFGPCTDPPSEVLQRVMRGKMVDGYEKGKKVVQYLKHQASKGARVEFAPVTRLEMACGLLRGRAILSAAGEGIPGQMWSRFSEADIALRLGASAYGFAQRTTAEIEDQFDAVGIEISETDPTRSPEVWALARFLLGLVFLDVGDCAVYASAVVAMAEKVITYDRYLANTATYLRNPASAPEGPQRQWYTKANRRLLAGLSRNLGVKPGAISLPVPHKP